LFTFSVVATERRYRRRRWIVGALAVAAVLAAAPYGARAQLPPTGPGVTTPAAPPPMAGMPAPALTPTAGAPAVAPAVPDTEIKIRLDSPAGVAVAGERLHTALLRRFYAAHNYEPVWNTRQAMASALLNAVMRAAEHGLDPELFHATQLRDPAALPPVDRDLLLSDAFLAYAEALARGVLPVEARMDDEDLKPEPIDVAAALDSAIASPDPAAAIEALAPNTPAYIALRQALQSYRAAAAARTPPQPAAIQGRPGQRSVARVAPAPNYDAKLRLIAVNLERQRWLPHSLPADRVWVNTAAAQLVLYRGDRPVFTTRVVVGETDKQTPEVQASIGGLLFNPPWNVPRSIAAKEIYSKLGQDPGYLARHHMIVRHGGLIQQLPPSALGQLKFEMPNRFDVYLHDTPMKALFSQDNRRRSHGCVRVQNPRELGALLLQQSVEVIDRRIGLGYTNSQPLPQPVPVFFVYQTAFADANGAIEFRPDVYQRDEEVWQHLHRAPQAPMAQREPTGQPRG
jgi:murein L,D-transpeptidase YcbB/YkuD